MIVRYAGYEYHVALQLPYLNTAGIVIAIGLVGAATVVRKSIHGAVFQSPDR
jgi:hypothetical protein